MPIGCLCFSREILLQDLCTFVSWISWQGLSLDCSAYIMDSILLLHICLAFPSLFFYGVLAVQKLSLLWCFWLQQTSQRGLWGGLGHGTTELKSSDLPDLYCKTVRGEVGSTRRKVSVKSFQNLLPMFLVVLQFLVLNPFLVTFYNIRIHFCMSIFSFHHLFPPIGSFPDPCQSL